jgi:hypothetical protein
LRIFATIAARSKDIISIDALAKYDLVVIAKSATSRGSMAAVANAENHLIHATSFAKFNPSYMPRPLHFAF